METTTFFNKFDLRDEILKAISDAGYTTPTKIQEASIPEILMGNDIKASAQTGTGKTAAFLLPSIQKISVLPQTKNPKILILTPTRELAQQITEQSAKYTKYLNLKSVCIVGGIPYHKQQSKLSKPYDILIATPGRLIDYMKRGKVKFSDIEMIVLDEADRMLDMGFSEAVEEILAKAPKKRQTLLFSATFKPNILKLSEKFMNNPKEVIVHSAKDKHENITQRLHYVDNLSHKNDLLDYILNAEDFESVIIFASTKRHCDELAQELEDKDFDVEPLHGDMSQRERNRTLKQLTTGKIQIIVATDVAARGIDIPTITHIINFDLPRDTEDYVHRIGRTGRAGKKGSAISFAGKKDLHIVPRIEEFIGQKISVVEIQGLEPSLKPQDKKSHSKNSGKDRKRGRSSRGSGLGRSGFSESRGRSSGRSNSSESRGRSSGRSNSSESRGRSSGRSNSSESRGRNSERSNSSESRGRSSERSNSSESRGRSSERSNYSESRGRSSERSNYSESRGRSSGRSNSSESRGRSSERSNSSESRGRSSERSFSENKSPSKRTSKPRKQSTSFGDHTQQKRASSPRRKSNQSKGR